MKHTTHLLKMTLPRIAKESNRLVQKLEANGDIDPPPKKQCGRPMVELNHVMSQILTLPKIYKYTDHPPGRSMFLE